MGRPKQPSTTVFSRVEEFKDDGMYVFDRVKKTMMCKYCNATVCWLRKSVVTRHCESDTHIKKKEKAKSSEGSAGLKKQIPVDDALLNSAKALSAKEELILDTTSTFLKANIPLEKIENADVRAWMNKYIKGSGDLPKARTVREKFVPKLRESREELMIKALQDKEIIVHCDETTDRTGKAVFVTIFKIISRDESTLKDCRVFVAGATVLTEVTGETTSKAIIELLNNYQVKYENVYGLACDGAAYMTKCARLLRLLVNPKMRHLQCWGHKLDKISGIFPRKLTRLNECVSKTKKLFKNTRKRKHNYFKFLVDKYKVSKTKTPKLFPSPVLTRWGSWKKSSDYIDDYVEDVAEYAKTLTDNDSSALKYFQKMTSEDVEIVKAEAAFLKEHMTPLYETVTLLEGDYPLAHRLYPRLKELLNSFTLLKDAKNDDAVLGYETKEALKPLHKQKQKNLRERISELAKLCCEKLESLLASDPAKAYFQAVEALFHPPNITSISVNHCREAILKAKSELTMFDSQSSSEFLVMYSIFADQVRDVLSKSTFTNENDVVADVLRGMVGTNRAFATAALQAINVSVANLDAERAFSAYGDILTPKRCNLKPENAEVMLAFTLATMWRKNDLIFA